MESKRFQVPEVRGYDQAYELSYRLASEKLAGIADLGQQCRRVVVDFKVIDSQKIITLKYLGGVYQVALPGITFSPVGGAEELTILDKVVILHYLISTRGTPLSNKPIPFRELPEGSVYAPTFEKRAVRPLVNQFGSDPGLLLQVGEKVGGHRVEYGDAAVAIDALSRVPVTVIIWRGDEEFPPQGNILFDATISDYLPTEDITVLCEIIARRLIKYSREASTGK